MASNIFNSVFFPKVKSNVFDLSYDLKLSLNMGDLVPTHIQEIVPGDKITMSTESMLRFAPLIAPVMHKVDVTQHFFFVPNRILWSGWENFITDKKPSPAFPTIENFYPFIGQLPDYFGIVSEPYQQADGTYLQIKEKVSALPFAAYLKIYDEYYRDQNLHPEQWQPLVDGDNEWLYDHLTLKKRAWQHDYFTASLPFAQKGDAVTLPIADFNDVGVYLDDAQGAAWATTQGQNPLGLLGEPSESAPGEGGIYAKTSDLNAGAATINDLRRAFRLQEWLEKNARGGSRYVENILAHFGVKSSDARLQRPEYLGGSKQPVIISEVLQTAEGVETPQGNMSGHGISVGSGKQFTYSAEEHGYIIGIMSVTPKTAYQQGLPKHFSKFDRLDYYWPSFAHLGEQEVKNKEIYYNPDDNKNDDVWGYVPRYSEYKYNDSRVAGDFRDSLAFWHLGRLFDSRPSLNQNFVECNPTTRIFAVEDPNVHKIYGHVFHRIKAVRKMPKYGTPEF